MKHRYPDAALYSSYHIFYDQVAERGAGLAILVHYRFLSTGQFHGNGQLVSETDVQFLLLRRVGGIEVLCINLYIRPQRDTARWLVLQRSVEERHLRYPNAIVILAGDLNEVLTVWNRGKVATAIKHGHPWAFLMVPYPLGALTNFVNGRSKVSRKEIHHSECLLTVDS